MGSEATPDCKAAKFEFKAEGKATVTISEFKPRSRLIVKCCSKLGQIVSDSVSNRVSDR